MNVDENHRTNAKMANFGFLAPIGRSNCKLLILSDLELIHAEILGVTDLNPLYRRIFEMKPATVLSKRWIIYLPLQPNALQLKHRKPSISYHLLPPSQAEGLYSD